MVRVKTEKRLKITALTSMLPAESLEEADLAKANPTRASHERVSPTRANHEKARVLARVSPERAKVLTNLEDQDVPANIKI